MSHLYDTFGGKNKQNEQQSARLTDQDELS